MKIAILGASRGLGASLVQHIRLQSENVQFFLSSRNQLELQKIARPFDIVFKADFTDRDQQKKLISELKNFNCDHFFYVAGGGPYGPYNKKDWKDHDWALRLNLLFPAEIIHDILKNREDWPSLKGAIFVGSAVAGQNPDPNAAAYAAAKHGLRGLINSIEKEDHPIKIKLFEPGYMDTTMLPQNAWPRQQGLARSAAEEAKNLWQHAGVRFVSDKLSGDAP